MQCYNNFHSWTPSQYDNYLHLFDLEIAPIDWWRKHLDNIEMYLNKHEKGIKHTTIHILYLTFLEGSSWLFFWIYMLACIILYNTFSSVKVFSLYTFFSLLMFTKPNKTTKIKRLILNINCARFEILVSCLVYIDQLLN